MKLTTKNILDICKALNDLRFNCRLEYKHARQLNDIKKNFNDRAEVIMDLEKKLIEDYKGTIGKNGNITFESSDVAKNFLQDREKLYLEEDEVDVVPINLSRYRNNAEINFEYVEAIDYVVTFDETESNENKEDIQNE